MTTPLTELPIWRALQAHYDYIADDHLRSYFKQDAKRFTHFSLTVDNILLDYSRNRITAETLPLLIKLADAVSLKQKINALFNGERINLSENRAVLHTALRDQTQSSVYLDGENIAPLISETQAKMRAFAEKIIQQQWLGVTGKPIKHIVNIGIGGSYLGPKMAVTALAEFAQSDLTFHFLSCVDEASLYQLWNSLDPASSLFIISSKSFSTLETLTNANTILSWMKATWGEKVLQQHFIAITAAADKARTFGIIEENIFPLWDWVGGRFSIWSAIGLPILLMLGEKNYNDFLAGGFAIDQHFRHAEFKENIPVILALLDIWYVNFFGVTAQAVIPYTLSLCNFPAYLQQAQMESNGKRNTRDGQLIRYLTSPITFGESGCHGQHSYFQLLHQGQHLIPLDFILFAHPGYKDNSTSLLGETIHEHHDLLIASALSQAQAFMRGKTIDEAYAELMATGKYSEAQAKSLAPHCVIPGNKPSNILFFPRLTPYYFGALIAIYEHKIFTTGIIWDINSFDQWGVELGKQLLPNILQQLHRKKEKNSSLDSATQGLIQFYQRMQQDDE